MRVSKMSGPGANLTGVNFFFGELGAILNGI